MPDFLAYHPPYARWAHVLLRIFTGALMAQHGAQKLFGVLGGFGMPGGTAPMWHQFWVAGILELAGGLLLILGLFTRVTGFILAGEMAVAYFTVHAKQGFWPIQNKGSWRSSTVLSCSTSQRLALGRYRWITSCRDGSRSR